MAGTYGASGETYGDAKGVYGQLAAKLVNTTDTGTGADASTPPRVRITRPETGTGAQTATLRNKITATQTSVVVDQVTVEMLIQEEFATGVDTSDLTVAFDVTGTDSGSGNDAASVSTTGGGTPVHAADTGHATDTGAASVSIHAFDTGTASIANLLGGGGNYFGGIYFGEYAGGTTTITDGEISTLVVKLNRVEVGLAIDSSIPLPHPPSPEPVPGLIVLSGTLRFRMGEGVLV